MATSKTSPESFHSAGCTGCRKNLRVGQGVTELPCPNCQMPNTFANTVDPSTEQLRCSTCKSLVIAPVSLARFPCPQCADELDVQVDGELVVEVGRDEDGGGVAGETFTDYRPAKVSMGPPHPDSIVETSSLFAVPPPKPTYEPMIKHPLESSKAFSCFQIETFIYACQRHTQHLPDGTRAGFFIGDGGDVGKVRILAGLIWENWHHGRKKALWISVGSDLNVDVRRDLDDIGATCIEVHALDELPYSKLGSKSVGVREGVIFLTYSSLIGCSEKGRTRLQQLVQWCGPGFDGLIIFDECHKAKPLVPEAGKKPTQTCEAVLDIQARLPEARVVYCSAAGTSESRIMAYMVRLDLWGDGTSFCDFGEFPVLMKEKEKKDKVIPTYPDIILPEEMVIEILRRLPVRSLLRFKTVCKRWRLLISNSTFCKSHCDMNYAPTHRLLLEKVDDYEIESFDLQASLHEDSAVVKLKFPPYRAPFFLTLGSCRGLVLLAKMISPFDFILWNPSTGAHREIPMSYVHSGSRDDPSSPVHRRIPPHFDNGLYSYVFSFGFDELRNDYVFVLIQWPQNSLKSLDSCVPEVISRPPIAVLSMKTNLCSFYENEVEYVNINHESKWGVFLKNSIHWLVKSKATQVHVLIAFDLVVRKLSEIPLSRDLAAELSIYKECNLRALGGCLAVCYSSTGGHIIWVMKDYKVQSSWAVSFHLPIANDLLFWPLFFTKDGGVVGSDDSGSFKKFSDSSELVETFTYDEEDRKCSLRFFDMYRESLLTLPLPGDFQEEETEDAL